MFAVQFHKFCFYKLCWVVVPGDTDCSSFGADGFKNKGKDFLYPVPVKVSVLYQIKVYLQTQGNKPLIFGGGSPDGSPSED